MGEDAWPVDRAKPADNSPSAAKEKVSTLTLALSPLVVPAAPAEIAKEEWVRVSDILWRLDDRWTVRREGPYWRAFRGVSATLCGFSVATEAMHEAELLRAADWAYSAPGALT